MYRLNILLALVGLAVGVNLASLRGSWYFLLIVLATLTAVVLLSIHGAVGAPWTAGPDSWPLVLLLKTLALLVALAYPTLKKPSGGSGGNVAYALDAALEGRPGGIFVPRPTVTASGDRLDLIPADPDHVE